IIEMHNNPHFYPNPERYQPERFTLENSSKRHPFAYIPFSAGPRNCIGQRFALMEEKIIVTKILRKFKIKSLDERDKIIYSVEMVLRPKVPIRIRFEKR